jgi:hypothetical protein
MSGAPTDRDLGANTRKTQSLEDGTMLNPFDNPMAKTFHKNLHAQAEKALALSQKAVDFQVDQAKKADKLAREQAVANTKAAMEAWQAGAKMVMDAHKEAVAAMAPKADAAEA